MNSFFTEIYKDVLFDIFLEDNNLTHIFLDDLVNRIDKTISSDLPSTSKSKELFKIKKVLYNQLKQQKFKNINRVRNVSELDVKLNNIIKDLSVMRDKRYNSLIYLDRFYIGRGKK